MDDVFCSERRRVSNTGARLRSGLMFCMDAGDDTSEGCSPPGKRAQAAVSPSFSFPFEHEKFLLQLLGVSEMCFPYFVVGVFVGMKMKGFKSLFALKSTF